MRPPAMRGKPYVWLGVFLVGVGLYRQFGVTGLGDQDLINTWLYYSVIVVGFYLVFGVSGQFAFSQGAFAAVGGYTSAWATRIGLMGIDSFWWGLVVAVVITGALAFAFSLLDAAGLALLLRHRHAGPERDRARRTAPVDRVHRLERRHHGRHPRPVLLRLHLRHAVPRVFWLWLGALGVVLLLTIFVARSPLQREAIAGRDQDVVASTLGVPTLRVRIVMFVLGSVIAGVAGAIFVHAKGFATPDQFGIDLGLGIFVMLILGGIDSRWGPVVGAAFYVFVPQWLQGGVLGIPGVELTVDAFGQQHRLGDFRDIFFGSLLVITMIVFPVGLVGVGRLLKSVTLDRARPANAHLAERPVRHHPAPEAGRPPGFGVAAAESSGLGDAKT